MASKWYPITLKLLLYFPASTTSRPSQPLACFLCGFPDSGLSSAWSRVLCGLCDWSFTWRYELLLEDPILITILISCRNPVETVMPLGEDGLGFWLSCSFFMWRLSKNPRLLVSGASFLQGGLIPTTQECLQESEWHFPQSRIQTTGAVRDDFRQCSNAVSYSFDHGIRKLLPFQSCYALITSRREDPFKANFRTPLFLDHHSL